MGYLSDLSYWKYEFISGRVMVCVANYGKDKRWYSTAGDKWVDVTRFKPDLIEEEWQEITLEEIQKILKGIGNSIENIK